MEGLNLHYFGAALGLGMIVIGAGLGIGRFAAAAAEGIARQPSAAEQITGAINLPLFLLEGARRIRAAVRIPVIYVGGVLSLEHAEAVLREGFQFAQVGRATVRDPAVVQHLQSGEARESDCDQCNRCIAAMEAGGVECVSATRGLAPRDHWQTADYGASR